MYVSRTQGTVIKRLVKNSSKIIAETILFLIQGVRLMLGSHGCCRYQVTCTNYARHQLTHEPLAHALWLIAKRVLSCHPFHFHR